jgi:hypothetical protein
MAKRLVKILKHDLTVIFAIFDQVYTWDEHLPRILFGYRCGMQYSTDFSPQMIVTSRIPKLRANNFLSLLVGTYNEDDDPKVLPKKMIKKM